MINPLYYNINILTQNMITLTNIQYNFFNYQKILKDNQILKNNNYKYINENNNLKKRLLESETSLELINHIKKKKINNTSNYATIIYNPNPFSWSDEKINNILESIKSINDIIKLENNWDNIKHNSILQKLYHLIPPLQKLNNMIGLSKIKNDIFKKIIYYIQQKSSDDYLHTIITGPPGVGKTEFSKIYADIFVRLGLLKTDKFIEIKRDDLVGEYLGQTSVKTRKLLDSAMDGVLFLDEAYSLGNEEKRDSFSKEAIDMINQYLSEKKDQFMFIIAGYEDDIESCLLAYNKGMKRRFQNYYNIDGYTPIELRDIFIQKIQKSSYNLNIDNDILTNFFINKKNNFKYYGGDIEKLITEIKHIQSIRTFNNNINNKDIIIEDINIAFTNLFSDDKKSNIHNFMYS